MEKFNYPDSLIKDYRRWVVLIRPEQLTLGSVVIASKSDVQSFGDLENNDMQELSSIIFDFEKTVRLVFKADKFNYLGLMMVDPNPHFHGIPRYSMPISFNDDMISDGAYPGQILLDNPLDIKSEGIQNIKNLLINNWGVQIS